MNVEEVNRREAQIGQIINDYLDRRGRGESVSEDEIVRAHPGLAEELRSHFELVQNMVVGGKAGPGGAGGGSHLPHDSLPGYEILFEIHRGGQGVVYQALQKGTRRKVAIKVMREGPFAGWRDRARFDREVQILSTLRHPSIVSIHDSGEASGSHYFVMDYIAGQPLDLWMSSGPRTIPQVLGLFVKICDAVNTAHLRGIIHRDLKPGNIRIDADGEPHVLDFGLAKLSSQSDGEGQTMTASGQFVGSLPWASPEQADGTGERIDTRTDVYALGVVLYQVLTSRFPYEVVGPMREVLDRIVNAEPARPSGIRAEIDGELDAIILKCLQKEPDRRYQTAGELGRELERYLRGEPITAKSDSGLYVLKKMLRRHHRAVAAAISFVLLLTVGLVVSLAFWRDAAAARDRALEAEHKQSVERARADAQSVQAEKARRVAEDQLYVNRIAFAQNACDNDELARALQLLDACPPEHRGWEWSHLRRRATRNPLLTLEAHEGPAKALSLSPDGRYAATGGADKTVRVWDLQSGREFRRLKGHAREITAVAFSPDGQRVFSTSVDATIRGFDLASGETAWVSGTSKAATTQPPSVGSPYAECLAVRPDGAQLAAGTSGGLLLLLDSRNGSLARQLKAPSDSATARAVDQELTVACVTYSPNGEYLACGEHRLSTQGESHIKIWEVSTGRLVRSIPAHSMGVCSLAYSPDGRRLASGSSIPGTRGEANGTLRVFDAATGERLLSTRGHEGYVNAVAFSPDGKTLASAGTPRSPYEDTPDKTVKLWCAVTGAERASFPAHQNSATGVAWTPGGSRIVSVGQDSLLRVWSNHITAPFRTFEHRMGSVRQVAFSPDGKRLVCGCARSRIDNPPEFAATDRLQVWDVDSGRVLKSTDAEAVTFLSVAWSPDGKWIATGDKSVRLWDAETLSQKTSVPATASIQNVAFSMGSDLLASASFDEAVVWRVSDMHPVFRTTEATGLRTVAFSPDGRWLAIGGLAGTIRIYEVPSCRESQLIHTDRFLMCMCFSVDSRTLLCGHSQGAITTWNVLEGVQISMAGGTGRGIQSIACSPDGKRFATSAADMLLRIWDVETVAELYAVRAHDGTASCVRFSPGGEQIATCGQDSFIRIWESELPLSVNLASEVSGTASQPATKARPESDTRERPENQE